MMDNNDRFISHLQQSNEAVWTVANWLHSRGNNVTVNAAGVRPSHEDWKEYADQGDLYISQRVEVKGLSAEFSCREDWPFGQKFIVCAKNAFDRATPKPHSFIYLNKARTHAAIVMGSTSAKWYVENRKDSRYDDYQQDFYFCPLDQVKFVRIGANKGH